MAFRITQVTHKSCRTVILGENPFEMDLGIVSVDYLIFWLFNIISDVFPSSEKTKYSVADSCRCSLTISTDPDPEVMRKN